VHIEFDADEAGGPRLRQGRLDEPQPETTPAVGGNDPHPERSSMRARRKAVPPNVAPSDDFVFDHRDKLKTAFLDEVHHEFAHLRQRRRFEEREVFSFACDDVERAMKALDVLGACRDNGDIHRRTSRAAGVERSTITKARFNRASVASKHRLGFEAMRRRRGAPMRRARFGYGRRMPSAAASIGRRLQSFDRIGSLGAIA